MGAGGVPWPARLGDTAGRGPILLRAGWWWRRCVRGGCRAPPNPAEGSGVRAEKQQKTTMQSGQVFRAASPLVVNTVLRVTRARCVRGAWHVRGAQRDGEAGQTPGGQTRGAAQALQAPRRGTGAWFSPRTRHVQLHSPESTEAGCGRVTPGPCGSSAGSARHLRACSPGRPIRPEHPSPALRGARASEGVGAPAFSR